MISSLTARSGTRLALISLLTTLIAWPLSGLAEVRRGDLVLFSQVESSPAGRLEELGELPVAMLNDADRGRQVAVAEMPPGWRHKLPDLRSHSLEVLILAGKLIWDGQQLAQYDYVYLPTQTGPVELLSGKQGAKLLLFRDPRAASADTGMRVLKTREKAWRPGVVAQQDTGQALALEVKDLLWVEETGQRTWLLRAGPDLSVPWEIHQGVEEGFLLEGDYRVGECLPDGEVTGDYGPGGYFYRPGGIVHSGPQSGSRGGALWLLRTPEKLTVDFVDGCPQG